MSEKLKPLSHSTHPNTSQVSVVVWEPHESEWGHKNIKDEWSWESHSLLSKVHSESVRPRVAAVNTVVTRADLQAAERRAEPEPAPHVWRPGTQHETRTRDTTQDHDPGTPNAFTLHSYAWGLPCWRVTCTELRHWSRVFWLDGTRWVCNVKKCPCEWKKIKKITKIN